MIGFHNNKLQTTLVRNYDRPTDLLTGVKCRVTSVAKNPLQMFNVLLQVTVSAMVISMMGEGSVGKFELRMTRAVANGQTPFRGFSPFLFCCYLKSALL